MKTNLLAKMFALLLAASPAAMALGQNFEHDFDRTRVVLDEFGNEVVQRARRVRVAGHWNQYNQWVPARWETVWEEIEVDNNNNDDMAPSQDFVYSKPKWVVDGENMQGPVAGYSFTKDPQMSNADINGIANMLNKQSESPLNVIKVHYMGYQVVQNPTKSLIVETRDRDQNMTIYWDIEISPVGQWNYSLSKAEKLPMVSANPPFIDNRSTVEANDPGKSVANSQQRLNVSFRNMQGQDLELIWVDFEGNERSYGEIAPSQSIEQETGDGHLWRFKMNGKTIGFFLADANGPQAFAIENGYRFARPQWVASEMRILQMPENQRPLGHYSEFFVNPNLDSNMQDYFANQLSKKAGKNLEFVRAHFRLNRNPAPHITLAYPMAQSFVIETRDADSGRARFWDAELGFPNGNRQMTNAQELKIVAALGDDYNGRDKDNQDWRDGDKNNNGNRLDYRRPAWVVQKQVPGGIKLEDENSPRMRWKADKALSMFFDQGINAELVEVLHAGSQSFYQSSKTHLVLRVKVYKAGWPVNDVWEVKLSESNGGSSAQMESIRK